MKVRFGNRFILALCFALAGVNLSWVCHAADPPRGPIEPVGKTRLETGWKAVTITGGLMHPWSAAWLPDGKTLLVTEREGRLRVVRDGKLRMDVVKGCPRYCLWVRAACWTSRCIRISRKTVGST
jgi:glucose/arabinose dehydrogenase